MIQTTCRLTFLIVVIALCHAAEVAGGVINHGMFMGPKVAYLDVTETSLDPVPLYGAPVVIGDALAFFEPGSSNPSLGFSAQATGGDVDFTDGFLNLTIMAKPGVALSKLTFSEGGDYTMSALGAALAQVNAVLNIFELKVTEVDNLPIAPIVLSDLQIATFNLPGDPVAGSWDLSAGFDIEQALIDAGEDFVLGATKITAKLDNTLSALSQPGSGAQIVKKDFDIDVETKMIPEPGTLLLALLGALGVAVNTKKACFD